jgi:hypothetical protein
MQEVVAYLFCDIESRTVGDRRKGVLNGLEIRHEEQELPEEWLNHDQPDRTDLSCHLQERTNSISRNAWDLESMLQGTIIS